MDFGRYRLGKELGRGGMAIVSRATVAGPFGFSRELVIKRMLPELARDKSFVHMLATEARLSARLRHPGIVQVYEFGEVAGEFYLAMELVDGASLAVIMRACAAAGMRVPVGVACLIVSQVAAALGYAHGLSDEQGRPLDIVHRDVTPTNIMITPFGATKLLDFGIAKAVDALRGEQTQTEVGAIRGKISYLSPEQAEGRPVDRRSDLFSLGVIFHELLTLRPLFRRGNDFETLRRIRDGAVVAPGALVDGIPPALDDIVLRMLARAPEERFPSGEGVVAALAPLTRQLAVDALTLQEFLREAPVERPATPSRPITPSPPPLAPARPRTTPTPPSSRSEPTPPRPRPRTPSPPPLSPSTPAAPLPPMASAPSPLAPPLPTTAAMPPAFCPAPPSPFVQTPPLPALTALAPPALIPGPPLPPPLTPPEELDAETLEMPVVSLPPGPTGPMAAVPPLLGGPTLPMAAVSPHDEWSGAAAAANHRPLEETGPRGRPVALWLAALLALVLGGDIARRLYRAHLLTSLSRLSFHARPSVPAAPPLPASSPMLPHDAPATTAAPAPAQPAARAPATPLDVPELPTWQPPPPAPSPSEDDESGGSARVWPRPRVRLSLAGPTGADVFVDGEHVGKLPYHARFPRAQGVRHLEVVKAGYRVWSRDVPADSDVALVTHLSRTRSSDGGVVRDPFE